MHDTDMTKTNKRLVKRRRDKKPRTEEEHTKSVSQLRADLRGTACLI